MSRILPRLPLPLLLTLAACAAAPPAEQLAELYAESREEARGMAEGSPRKVARARRARVDTVLEFLAAGEVVTAQDRLYAVAVLLDSDRSEDLDTAADLALAAAEQGDDRALPLAAEAIDRSYLLRDLPQKYGTQYIFDPISGRWCLYRCDPRTTDRERVAMGLVSLDVAREREAILNQR